MSSVQSNIISVLSPNPSLTPTYKHIKEEMQRKRSREDVEMKRGKNCGDAKKESSGAREGAQREKEKVVVCAV